jgi:alanyl-tRNA synthetase
MVTKDLTYRFSAGEIIKPIAALVGGRGGGKPELAQAGGPIKENLRTALAQAYEIIEQAAKKT